MPREIKEMLENYVENILFKGIISVITMKKLKIIQVKLKNWLCFIRQNNPFKE